jgi:hypothetical protein
MDSSQRPRPQDPAGEPALTEVGSQRSSRGAGCSVRDNGGGATFYFTLS